MADKLQHKTSLLSRWRTKNKNNNSLQEGITPIPKNVPIPLSREQKRLWFLQQINLNNPFYNYSELYRLKGDLNISFFEKSIRYIETKHDILKSNFIIEDGKPSVIITPDLKSKFNYVDFSNLSISEAQQKADDLVRNNARVVFDLAHDSLMETTIIKVANNNFLFLIVMHHIITDKWSMRVFRKDLATCYSSLLANQTPQLEKLEIQYPSYAYWQQNKATNTNALAYWKNKLSGNIPTLELPLDFSRKPQPTYKGTFHKKVFSKKIAANFFELCKKLETTPYVVMLSIYYILLHKYSRQQDILIGTPITKRDEEVLEGLIGFFNDTLVLRTQFETTNSFEELVAMVKQTTLEAFANKDVSFDMLVKELNPERSMSVHPFFQAMFLYHKVPETPVLDPSIDISYEPYDMGVSKFDLTIYISDDKGDLTSLMEYETDLFSEHTIIRMHDHFHLILESVIQNSNTSIDAIEMNTIDEIHFYNQLASPKLNIASSFKGIHEIIANQAKQFPENTALIFKDEKITYQQLDNQANKVAAALISSGIQINDIIGLCITRSPKMIIGLLGILKAGATYLPLDPKYPEDRIRYILQHSKSQALLIESNFITTYESSLKTIDIDDVLNTPELAITLSLPQVLSNNLAYVIYTSGSTGTPKGVSITHENIINSTLARAHFYKEAPSSFLLMSSIAFDSSKAGLFWSLCTGAALVISEDHLEQDLEKLTTTINQHNISHTLMLPSLYQAIINYADLNKLQPLKAVIVAGEACTNQLVKTHFDKLPNIHLYNEYGPTEGTVWCLAHKIESSDIQKSSIPIGKSVANTEIYILDEQLQHVPFGTIGELYIGGKSLASGYFNDPEKTAEAFINNPFKDGKKLYKTGDLVKFNNDGTIQFLGRKDQQVKVRGYRIELDEIEQHIYNDANVAVAAVVVENSNKKINIETLKLMKEDQIAQLLKDHFSETEIDKLFNSVEHLNEDELEVLLNNL